MLVTSSSGPNIGELEGYGVGWWRLTRFKNLTSTVFLRAIVPYVAKTLRHRSPPPHPPSALPAQTSPTLLWEGLACKTGVATAYSWLLLTANRWQYKATSWRLTTPTVSVNSLGLINIIYCGIQKVVVIARHVNGDPLPGYHLLDEVQGESLYKS